MISPATIRETPWDSAALGMPSYEITEYSPAVLHAAEDMPGHHTIRVSPLADKSLLHEQGFYYCDTLIRPVCSPERLRPETHARATISDMFEADDILKICRSAFTHGRFHRDFNIARDKADKRYTQWLAQRIDSREVHALRWEGATAGFIAHQGCDLVLHAVAEELRGRGLAKYWWSEVCTAMFAKGCEHVASSVSAANVAALNLYASLGFHLTEPIDVYHRVISAR